MLIVVGATDDSLQNKLSGLVEIHLISTGTIAMC
jgi:hypothetical protein